MNLSRVYMVTDEGMVVLLSSAARVALQLYCAERELPKFDGSIELEFTAIAGERFMAAIYGVLEPAKPKPPGPKAWQRANGWRNSRRSFCS